MENQKLESSSRKGRRSNSHELTKVLGNHDNHVCNTSCTEIFFFQAHSKTYSHMQPCNIQHKCLITVFKDSISVQHVTGQEIQYYN